MTTILLGTTKGAFVARETDGDWDLSGPHCDGWPINHAIGDPATGTIWAGGGGEWSGAGVWRSADGGASWQLAKMTRGQMDHMAAEDADFAAMIGWQDAPAPFAESFVQIWSLGLSHGRLYAGSKPARLLVSDDDGGTWSEIEGLRRHPSAESWTPGAAGLVLHSIVGHPQDPARLWIGISAAGVFATEDGGATWDRRNRLSNAGACVHHDHPAAPRDGETGHCVHNMVRATGTGDTGTGDLLYQQNHHGVWRSSDGGRSWDDIGHGLPSTFGFPIVVDPHDARRIWTVPLNGVTEGRYPPDGAAAVWHSADGGESWAAQRAGLPQRNCFFTVLRQAMATDAATPAGIYFGTNSGSVFASRDGGARWQEILRHLPTILSVETMRDPH